MRFPLHSRLNEPWDLYAPSGCLQLRPPFPVVPLVDFRLYLSSRTIAVSSSFSFSTSSSSLTITYSFVVAFAFFYIFLKGVSTVPSGFILLSQLSSPHLQKLLMASFCSHFLYLILQISVLFP